MFLKDLTDDEKYAFLELAFLVAHADGDMADVEAEMIAYFRIELGIPEDHYAIQGWDVPSAAATFTTDGSRRAALMELMLVVMADGVAHPGEHLLLVEIAEALGLDEECRERQFTWVQRLMALMATGKRLIEEGDPYSAAR